MNNRTNLPVVQKGGFAIYETDQRIVLVDHQIGGLITMSFVLILLTTILLVSGAVIISLNLMVGTLILLGSGLCGYIVYWALTRIKRKKSASLEEQPIMAILDFEKGHFLDSGGNNIALLSEVKFSKGFQITSSSPSIKASFGKGQSKEIFKFNGLIGGSAAFIVYFKKKELWKS